MEWLKQQDGLHPRGGHGPAVRTRRVLVQGAEKLRNGTGGVWRIPPSFDGASRSPLPRFTVLSPDDLRALSEYFSRWARLLTPVLVPGANVIVATNPLLSHVVAGALAAMGLERRGEIVRLVMTMRGGDRPKGAHDEFSDVSVMPRSMWEPWIVFRKPLEGRVQDNLRKWRTGGFRRPSPQRPFGDVIRSSPTRKEERALAAASEPEAASVPPAIGQRGPAARRGYRSRSVLRSRFDACRGGSGGLPERRYRERFGVLRHGLPWYSSTEKLPAGAGRHVSDSVDPVLSELPDAVAMQRGGTRPQLSPGIAPEVVDADMRQIDLGE